MPGQIVESCDYHPVLLTAVNVEDDELVGIDLYEGYETRCSIDHCGAFVMTAEQVAERIRIRDRLLDAERLSKESGSGDNSAYRALGLDVPDQ